MVMFQNLSQGPPSSLLQVAVKNSQQPVWYFNDKVLLHVFFTEDGRMERTNFLEVKIYVAISSFWSNMVVLPLLANTKTKRRRERIKLHFTAFGFAFLCL
jgi:hypothetical protein